MTFKWWRYFLWTLTWAL